MSSAYSLVSSVGAARSSPAMDFPKGKCLSLSLTHGPPVRGFVHTVDRKAGLLCVEELFTANFILIATKSIVSTTPISSPPNKRVWPDKVQADIGRIRAEEDRILRKMEAQYRNIGVGVSPEGQAIYDVLAKTLDCRWQNETIVIFDTVHLLPPYSVNDIVSNEGDAAAKERVRKVLENERPKIVSDSATNGLQK